ncbi:DNRLRE domain-containing protein [Spirillospora sp. NPDC048824]|uniref:golvesin C-terminal-like domain-containing protein n=1 Tax=unclassified Spirillospora TaxID=2642701 RepID=UPI003722E608
MSRFRRLLAGMLVVVLALALAPPARAQQPRAGAEASDPGDGWKPESKRNAWDRFKGLFGDDDPEPRKLAAGGVPRNDPKPRGKKAAPAKRVKELAGRRSANAKVYQLADGRLQKELSAVPLHYRGKDGDWHDIDPRIKPTDRKGFAYGNQTNAFESFFGTRPGELVTFKADGASLTLGVPQAKPGKPKTEGNAVTYHNLLGDGADVSYEVARDALKEKIVLDAPPKDGVWRFTVKADGVRAWQRPDGSIAFYRGDFDGRPVFVMPKPFMYDSKTDASSPFGKAWSPKVTQSMRWDAKAGLLHITVQADKTWLNDAERAYPVVIDPTIKIAPTPTQSQDTMISSDGPATNYDDSWRLSVGTTNSGKSRALLKFPLDEIPSGTRIDSAQLQLFYDQNHTSSANPVTLEARRATAEWDETTATWNNASGIAGELSGNTEQVDDGDPGKTSVNGTWSRLHTFDGSAVGNDLYTSKNTTTGDSYTWVPRVTESGTYQVQAHYKQYDDAAADAPYTVTYNGGSKVYSVDQSAGTAHAGVWKTLGSHPFAAGTQGSVKLGDVSDSSKRVVADAVRLFKPGTAVRPAGDGASRWHSFSVRDTVQHWLDGSHPNHGFVVKAADENTLGQGGPRYEGSLFFYNGETATYPKLTVTYGRPGVQVDPPTTIHATGAEVTWPAYTDPSGSDDDDIVEYQVHRSVWQSFTPSAATLIAPVAKDVRSYTDTTAQPTPADSTDPFGNSYYYMVAVKTRDGTVTPGPTQLARLPKAGRVTRIYQTGVTDTTLTASRPDENQDVLAGEPWLMAGNNSGTYGTSRAALRFPDLTDIPASARVLDAQVKLWTAGVDPGGAGTYELRGLTRDFDETTATWNNATTGTAWTTPGGDMTATASGTGGNWSNDPQQRNLTATSLVQQWVADPAANHGAIVKLADETTPTERAIFVSSEGREPQLRPQLVVTYLETTPENTYYVPATPASVTSDSTQTLDVTLTNTTTSTWMKADYVLSYRWSRPDGTPVTVQQLHTALPRDLVPGDTVTVQAQVKAPPPSTEGNKRVDHALEWDMWNTTTSTWLSQEPAGVRATAVNRVGALKQSLAVEESTSDQVGLEKFYAYAGKNTGAGSTVMNNLHAGNAAWQYNAFTNPSRGLATFLRLAYNSKDTSDTVAGYGWSIQASSLMRLGTPIDPHPNTHGRTVSLTDGDGTTHTFTLDDKDTQDPADDEYTAPAGVHYYLQRLAECRPKDEIARAWQMTRPDRTQFFFDCDGYLSAIEDNNGNRMDFTYEVRKSQNKPTKFLRYITDPAGRQTLTIDYWAKGDDYSYIDDDTWEKETGTGLTNPHIIDHIKSISDISGRTLTFTYSAKGLLGELVDGAGSSQPKTFAFQYDATQGNKNVKLVKVTDPRGHATDLAYYDTPQDDPKFKWSLKTITDRLGHPTTFAYTDPDGTAGQQIRTVVTDAENHATTYLMDGKGRPIETTNAKQQTTKLGWDDDNNVTRLEEPPATTGATPAISTWAYDPKTGYPTEIKDAEAVKNGWDGTRLTYQTGLNGHIADLISKQSPEGRTHTFTYTPEGDLSSVTDPLGTATSTEGDYTTRYTYDTWGQLKTATDANGNTTTNSEFGPHGYPKTITDPLQKSTTFVYDERGQVTKVTNALSHDTTQAYDTYGRPLESSVPKDQSAGDIITTPAPEYDANDNAVKVYAPNGAVATAVYDDADQIVASYAPRDEPGDPERKTTFTYDKVGNLTSQTDPKGNLTATAGDFTVTSVFDELNRVTEVVNSRGEKITSTYDNVGNLVKVVDPRKNATADTGDYTTKYTYDLNHRPKSVIDATGESTSTNYDRDGLPIETIDQENNKTIVSFDARGKPYQVKVPHKDDGGIVHNTTRYEYDQVGNQTKTITPRGVATAAADDFTYQTVYDELNRVKEQLTAYDPADARYNQPDRTLFDYDPVGRMSKVSAPPSQGQMVRNETRYTYFDNGWTRTSSDPWDISTEYDYNLLGQQTSSTLTSAGGSSSRTLGWEFYPSGNLKARTDSGIPVGSQVVLVDNSDYNNTAENPSGAWTAGTADRQHGYNVHTRPAGDGTGLFVWQLTVPQDGTYEVFARHSDTTGAAPDARMTVTHAAGETTKTVDQTSGAGEWQSLGSYGFTENSPHKITLTDQATAGTTVVADAVMLVRDNSGDTDNENKAFTYRYDPNGNLIEVGDNSPGAAIDAYATTYDDLNRVAKVEEKTGTGVVNTTAYTYDANGNPLTRAHDSTWSKFDYNTRDLIEKITNAPTATSTDKRVSTFTYTPRGQLDTQTKPNGNTVTFTYTLDGLITHQAEKKSGGGLVAEHNLDYTPNGHIATDAARLMNADNPGALLDTTYAFTYDPQDRIAKVTKTGNAAGTETYAYDGNNNVVTQTVAGTTTTHNYDRNRLLTSTANGITSTYNYDPLGRLDTVSTGGQINQKYRYDGFDRIASQTAGTGSAAKTTTYTYDPFDRTTSKTEGSKRTDFTYLATGSEVLTEEVAGKVTKSYEYSAWGSKLTQLKHTDPGQEISQYIYHPRGDVEAITKPNGDTRATYGYTAYGENDAPSFTGVDKPDPQNPGAEPYNAYRFNAHRWDQGSGTYDMGFRNYDPGLNRFLTRDMYGGALSDMALATDPFTMNRYAFGGGNPISNIEYNGHFGWKDLGNGLAGAATSAIGTLALANPFTAPIEMAGWAGIGPGVSGDFQNHLEQAGVDPGSGSFKTGFWATEIASIALDGAGAYKTGGKAAVRGGARLIRHLLAQGGDKAATAISRLGGDAAAAAKASSSAADSIPAKGGTTAKAARPRTGPAPAAQAPKCSFLAGTSILMADGSQKNIEQIQAGDQVTATDPETSETRPRAVVEPLTEKGKKTLVTITIDLDGNQGSQTAEIAATDNHPFWLPDYGRWANAGDLKAGMWLRTSAGTWVQIKAIARESVRDQRVHNLLVAGTHSYYVLVDGTPVLVHNCGGKIKYGTGISRLAVDARKANNWLTGGRNVAAIVFSDRSGGTRTAVARSWGRHAEKRAWDKAQKMGATVDDVDHIYTELAPCDYAGCDVWLATTFREANVWWSFNYTHGRGLAGYYGRRAGMNALKKAIAGIRRGDFG